jgi:hypothetical protein
VDARLSPSSVPCPIIDDAPLPPECIPYDPQAMMDFNERYKDHYPVAAESFAAFEAKRDDIMFGGAGPQGGCVEGTATETTLEMAVLGPIMDGGCTVAVGH